MQFTYGSTAGVGSTYKYIAGTPVKNTDLLVNISVSASADSCGLFVPTFTASPTTGRYRLTQWQECADTSGQQLPGANHTIGYQNGQVGVGSGTTTLPSGSDSPGRPLGSRQYDFNGDGHTDLVYAGSNGHWYVALGTSSGFATPIDTGIVPPVGESFSVTSGHRLRWHSRQPMGARSTTTSTTLALTVFPHKHWARLQQ